jgi:undecaprenyl diphosphate synthase
MESGLPSAIGGRPAVLDAASDQDEDAEVDSEPTLTPRHVAVIMDGNRRWARLRGLPEAEGHAAGVEAIRPLLRRATEQGVAVLSLYAFSRENWSRSEGEIQTLFALLESAIRDETPELVQQGVRVRILGRMDELPPETRASIEDALVATAAGARMTLNVAFNYSGRSEIVDAARRCIADGLPPEDIDEAALEARLYTSDLPDPDLLIRTGGDLRISNFLIWQAAYAELYFTERLWPDFDPAAFDEALAEYARRSRRFGR